MGNMKGGGVHGRFQQHSLAYRPGPSDRTPPASRTVRTDRLQQPWCSALPRVRAVRALSHQHLVAGDHSTWLVLVCFVAGRVVVVRGFCHKRCSSVKAWDPASPVCTLLACTVCMWVRVASQGPSLLQSAPLLVPLRAFSFDLQPV
jgi:hypothetical protein